MHYFIHDLFISIISICGVIQPKTFIMQISGFGRVNYEVHTTIIYTYYTLKSIILDSERSERAIFFYWTFHVITPLLTNFIYLKNQDCENSNYNRVNFVLIDTKKKKKMLKCPMGRSWRNIYFNNSR